VLLKGVVMENVPTRNLALELVRVTEAAALSAGRQVGRGNKIEADRAAVDAMRLVINTIEMNGHIVIGEGEKDEAPMLYNGEDVGTGGQPEVDIAVDPIDGTRLVSLGLSNAIATIALAPCGAMFNPGPVVYMHKLAVGPQAKDVIDIEAPVEDNLKQVARARGVDVNDLTVVILDRPRHEKLISEVRKTGARIRLIQDGDVSGALMTAWPESRVDILMGIGGTPEGVLAACALRCMGGTIQGKLYARSEEEQRRAEKLGYDFKQVMTLDDLISSDDVFFAATGITDGELLRGVSYSANSARTDSLVMRGLTGTVRQIIATHSLKKLARISPIQY
jgi:fructose-1,6-bisphosphatase II